MSGLSGPAPTVTILTTVHPPMDARVFHRQARSLAGFGYDVLLIAPGAPRHPVDGVRFASLPSWGGRAARPIRWPVAFWKALRSRADLYHLHDPELLPWGVLLRWLSRRPVVYDSHEYLREDILSKPWVPRRLRPLMARLASGIERWCAPHLSAVVAVTEEMRDQFAEVQPRSITVKNLPPAPGVPYPPGQRRQVVAYAGLINAERGLDILHETARLVRLRFPAAEFHILGTVAWDGLAADQKRTSAEWAAVGVRYLGTVPPAEVAAIISEASVGWLPRNPDIPNNLLAWPNKLVEYMIVGLPIVASDLPLQAHVVRTEGCGLVVEPLSPAAHADAICRLLGNPSYARELGETGRRAALERYTWEAEAERLHSLYRSLLATGGWVR